MPNTKAIGGAFADALLERGTVNAASPFAAVNATKLKPTCAVTGASFTSSGDAAASNAVAGSYFYSTAITANTTTTTAPKGSFGFTSNATGLGKVFYSDGSKWQVGNVT